MPDLPLLPIEPTSHSLTSHLAAFDQLIAQLEIITGRTRWQAQIPLNSKARVSGEVVHTNDVKVCLGSGWWVEMTAREAVEYLNRKKMALLEHHLREREGVATTGASRPTQSAAQAETPCPLPPAISFNPLFRHPVGEEAHEAIAFSQSSDIQPTKAEPYDEPETSEANALPVTVLPTRTADSEASSEQTKPSSAAISSSPPATTPATSNTSKSSAPTPLGRTKQAHVPKRSSPLNPSSSSSPPTPLSASTAPPHSTSSAISSNSAINPAPSAAEKAKTAEALADLLRQIADADKLDLRGAKEDAEPLVNEDGLPIHEIRETPNGDAMEGSLVSRTEKASVHGTDEEDRDLETETKDKKMEYWSTEAVAKRKALFDRVFGGGSESDEDEVDELDTVDEHSAAREDEAGKVKDRGQGKGKGRARHEDSGESEDEEEERASFPLSIGARRSSSPPPIPDVGITIPTPLSPTSASIAAGVQKDSTSSAVDATPSAAQPPTSPSRRTSASMPPPAKSILKSATRKKSVSFDESVPLPPDSPDRSHGSAGKGKMGFQLPLPIAVGDDVSDTYGEKAVPTIQAPIPKNKADQGVKGANGFAGFKRGFLNVSAAASNSRTDPAPAAPVDEAQTTRKPSLFAQRMAQKAAVDSPATTPPIPPSDSKSRTKQTPALPKMSESVGTSSVKPAVVEKPPAVRETVKEASQPEIANWTPLSQLPPNAPSGFRPGQSSASALAGTADGPDADEDEDEDDYDSHELSFDSDEEDEYDLDDALLAREMALEYHRRKMYQRRKYGSDEENEEADTVGEDGKIRADPDTLDLGGTGANGLGNVMLALPQVEGGDGPQIVNPTPDDWRRFVRVGRLENGNLVLAPGQEGWEEGDEEEGSVAADAELAEGVSDNSAPIAGISTKASSALTSTTNTASPNESTLSAEEKRANVERMKRVILGLEEDKPVKPATVVSPASQILLPPTLQRAESNDAQRGSAQTAAVAAPASVPKGPPAGETKGLGNIVERSSRPAVGGVREKTGATAGDMETPAPPKKVSRFKAARQGA